MMVRATLILVLGSMAIASAQGRRPSAHYVDLLRQTADKLSDASQPAPLDADMIAPQEEQLATFAVVVSHGEKPKPLPLEIQLLPFDSSTYAVEDLFTYELVIKNIGNQPIRFPVELDRRRFNKKMKEPRSALILISSGTADSRAIHFSQELFGAADVVKCTGNIGERLA